MLIAIRELNVIQKTDMITVQILEDTDTIQPTDWCRPLRLTTMSGGMSDYYSFESCYSGLPENNVRWCRFEQVFGDVWYGKTVGEFTKKFEKYGGYEFIRGSIPKEHQYGPTKPELKQLYVEYLKCNVIDRGKYKDYTLYHIQQKHPEYFNWAVNQGIIKDETNFQET